MFYDPQKIPLQYCPAEISNSFITGHCDKDNVVLGKGKYKTDHKYNQDRYQVFSRNKILSFLSLVVVPRIFVYSFLLDVQNEQKVFNNLCFVIKKPCAF